MSKDWMSVRIPTQLAEEIRAEAKARGTTITHVVEERLQKDAAEVVFPSSALSSVQVLDISDVAQTDVTPIGCSHPPDRQKTLSAISAMCLDCRKVYKT